MKRNFVRALPFWAVLLIPYYLLPILALFMPEDAGRGAMALLLLIFQPICVLMIGFLHGKRCGVWDLFAMGPIVLFVPAMMLFYSGAAWPYAMVYALLAFVGDIAGGKLRRRE